MKYDIKNLIQGSLRGFVYIVVASPFLALSCLLIGLIVKMAINVFMYGFNLL